MTQCNGLDSLRSCDRINILIDIPGRKVRRNMALVIVSKKVIFDSNKADMRIRAEGNSS